MITIKACLEFHVYFSMVKALLTMLIVRLGLLIITNDDCDLANVKAS